MEETSQTGRFLIPQNESLTGTQNESLMDDWDYINTVFDNAVCFYLQITPTRWVMVTLGSATTPPPYGVPPVEQHAELAGLVHLGRFLT